MQNSTHKWLRLFIDLCLIPAGFLLLFHTVALAESYIRVLDKEVVYYYFSSRKPPQFSQSGVNPLVIRRASSDSRTKAPPPEGQTFIQKMDQLHNLRPLAIRAALRMESDQNPKAAFPKGDLSLSQLKFSKTDDLPVLSFFDPNENIWMGSRYLGRLLAKFRYISPVVSAAPHSDTPRTDCLPALPPIQEIQALVRHACSSYLNYAQEQPCQLAQLKPGADPLAWSSQFSYCFPVAPPFSFRDSWGDFRSGGRYHLGVDIVACEGTPVYAITTGVVRKMSVGPESGITLFLEGQDGKSYGYMHLQGYAEGIVEGKAVKRGEVIAYVGRTGIRYSSAHLHLQVYNDHNFDRDKLINPYDLLVQLCNGKGVTDLLDRKMARQIPEDILRNRIPPLSRSIPHRYLSTQRSLEDYLKLIAKTSKQDLPAYTQPTPITLLDRPRR